IGIAVVIVIAHRYAAVEAAACQARRCGYVREHPIAIVAKQPVAVFGIVLLQRGQIGAIREEDVGTSISVVIEYGHAAGHGVECVGGGSLAMLESERHWLE